MVTIMKDEENEKEGDNYEKDHNGNEKVGRRRGISTPKKIFIIIIILVIMVAAFSIFWMSPHVKSIIVNSPIELDDRSGIRIEAHIALEGGGTSVGEGTIEIIYDEKTVYSGKINIQSDKGGKDIAYDKFVVGNKQYEIKVTFNGKSGSTFFKLDDNFGWAVSENINVTASLSSYEKSEDVRLKVQTRIVDENNLNLPPPMKASVEITIRHENGQTQTFNQDISYPNSSCEFNDYDYLKTGSGNYTIDAKLINHYVIENSKYQEIELEEPARVFFNIYPVAEAGDDQVVRRGVNVHFDGSKSWNDGPIRRYEWDFDYKDDDGNGFEDFTTDATGMAVDNVYNTVGTYTLALRVVGGYLGLIWDDDLNKYIIHYEQDINTCKITVRIL